MQHNSQPLKLKILSPLLFYTTLTTMKVKNAWDTFENIYNTWDLQWPITFTTSTQWEVLQFLLLRLCTKPTSKLWEKAACCITIPIHIFPYVICWQQGKYKRTNLQNISVVHALVFTFLSIAFGGGITLTLWNFFLLPHFLHCQTLSLLEGSLKRALFVWGWHLQMARCDLEEPSVCHD